MTLVEKNHQTPVYTLDILFRMQKVVDTLV